MTKGKKQVDTHFNCYVSSSRRNTVTLLFLTDFCLVTIRKYSMGKDYYKILGETGFILCSFSTSILLLSTSRSNQRRLWWWHKESLSKTVNFKYEKLSLRCMHIFSVLSSIIRIKIRRQARKKSLNPLLKHMRYYQILRRRKYSTNMEKKVNNFDE